jgi:hypothetical protein
MNLGSEFSVMMPITATKNVALTRGLLFAEYSRNHSSIQALES